ncbi:MAG: glycosyltransferase [bacterium]|nr:glycosyltransferase [bacterium]
MKVLLVAQHAEPSDGWGTLARTTSLGLLHSGHEVEILMQKPSKDLQVTQHNGLLPPLELLRNPLFILHTAWKITSRIRAFKPDIIHVLAEPYALAFPYIPKRLRHPWVITGCGTYTILPFAKFFTGRMWRKVYRDTDYVLSISRYTESRILQELSVRTPYLEDIVAKKMSVYTLGIEWPADKPQRQSHEEKRLVFVGGVKERKGIREIIEACGTLKNTSAVPFHVDIIGSIPDNVYTKALKSRVQELLLESNVTFRGHISEEELLQSYADADVFLMLSIPHGMHFEGYGLVFLEANAFGVPVIGPNDSGCTNAISDGKSGYTVDPKNPEAVAEALKKILEQGAIDSSKCIAWAKEHSVELQTKETEKIYETVLAKAL